MKAGIELDCFIAENVFGETVPTIAIATIDSGGSAAVYESSVGPFYNKRHVEEWIRDYNFKFGEKYQLGEWKNPPGYSSNIVKALRVMKVLNIAILPVEAEWYAFQAEAFGFNRVLKRNDILEKFLYESNEYNFYHGSFAQNPAEAICLTAWKIFCWKRKGEF